MMSVMGGPMGGVDEISSSHRRKQRVRLHKSHYMIFTASGMVGGDYTKSGSVR